MPKYFPGVTHCKVVTPKTAQDMEQMGGTIAIVVLCFGSDDNRLQPVSIKKINGPASTVAEIPKAEIIYNGKRVPIPLLSGGPADEVKVDALVAFDRVKSKYGLKFNKSYRVFANDIEEIGVTTAESGRDSS